MKALLLHVVDENVVHALKADRAGLADFRDIVCGGIDIFVTKHQGCALLWPVHKTDFGGKNNDAGAFRTNERTRDVESALGKKLVKTVARDAARNVGIALADQISVSITQGAKAGINLCTAATSTDDLLKFSI